MDNRPIGVFDSGTGGLTAMEELIALLPREHIIYLGDSYNMPYGEKTVDKIIELARADLRFMLERGVKAILIACGTVTANALEILVRESPVPVLGVVDAAVSEALDATKNGRIGVLATSASIRAETFQRRLKAARGDLVVKARACPVFASMAEDGIFNKDDPRVRAAAGEYLPPLKAAEVDTVILGCTHYPLLSEVIREFVGEDVNLISSGAAAARSLGAYLEKSGLTAGDEHKIEYYTTGDRDCFVKSAECMLKRDISDELTKIPPLCFDKTQNT